LSNTSEGDTLAAPASRDKDVLTLPERPLWKTFVVFLGPLLLSNILQSLSGTVNNVYLGQMIGVKALAAVSSFFPVMFFFIAFVIGLGSGSSVLIGQAWGARRADAAREVAGSTLTLGILLGLTVAVLGGVFAQPILRMLGTPADILPDAVRVARILLTAMPATFVFLLYTSMLRGVGDPVAPLFSLMISTVTGLLLTPAFIRGWLGLPRLGVTSAAWATVVALVLSMLWLAWHLRRKKSPLKPDREFLRHMRLNAHLIKGVLRVGVPTGLQMVLAASADLVLLSLVNSYGSSATAAYGAVNQVTNYVQFPAISISITSSVLGAHAIGAGHTQRLSAIVRTAMLMNLLLTGSLAALGYLFSRQVIGLFLTNAPVVEIAQTRLHIMLWSIVVFGMYSMLAGIMRASGTVWTPTLITIGALALVELPTAWIASHYIGLNGVWAAPPVAFCVILLLQWTYYRTVWRKRAIVRLV
jgi:putative MATE family efflux protein